MTANNKGVFNGPQHAEEIDMLMRGDYKQFQIVSVDVSSPGFAAEGGNRGLFEMEGNAISCLPAFLDSDGANENFSATYGQTAGRSQAIIYIKFNHWDNPWLPLGMGANINSNPNLPCAYCLTFGRFWIKIVHSVGGSKVYLLVTRGVSMYSPSFGPVVIGGYQAPTWQKLKP